MHRLVSPLLVIACACSGSQPKDPGQPATEAPPQAAAATVGGELAAESKTASTPPPARDLGTDSDFAALLRLARGLLRHGGGASGADCILGRRGDAFVLHAPLMPALDQLPEPPARLADRLERDRGPVAILSAWGVLAGGSSGDSSGGRQVAAAFTATPPQAPDQRLALLALTADGVFLRYGERQATTEDGPLRPDQVVSRLLTVESATGGVERALYVSADAAISVEVLDQLLYQLPAGRSVALSVLLPKGTELPGETPPPALQRCPDGLPELAADAAFGDLPREAVVAALAPLQQAAAACMAQARGAAAVGGRLSMALRVGPGGKVERGCLLGDAIGDARLGACVLDAATSLRFPAPEPSGSVDVHLPLSLEPEPHRRLRTRCD
ncbi:MAG: hypothetical protein OEZ06_12405 [Myxococcales bacterium]|nr:hypothetical protein [Myxococcales bacterium]